MSIAHRLSILRSAGNNSTAVISANGPYDFLFATSRGRVVWYDDLIYTRLAKRYNAAVLKEMAADPFAARELPVQPVVRDYKTAREAVFVVEWLADYHSSPGHHECPIEAQGTAFPYRELNLLVTCDHVLVGKAEFAGMEVPADFDAPEVVNKMLSVVRPETHESWAARVV